jgi:hypothetical protein
MKSAVKDEPIIVLDACSLIAFFNDEPRAGTGGTPVFHLWRRAAAPDGLSVIRAHAPPRVVFGLGCRAEDSSKANSPEPGTLKLQVEG